jgi:hypothetical protein
MTPTASCLKKFRLELIAPRLSKLWEISYSIYGAKGVIKEEGSLFPMALFPIVLCQVVDQKVAFMHGPWRFGKAR